MAKTNQTKPPRGGRRAPASPAPEVTLTGVDTAPARQQTDQGSPVVPLPIIRAEYGVSLESIYTRSEILQYTPDELLTKKGLKILEKMAMTDDVIQMGLSALKMMRLASGYQIVEASDDPLDIEIADMVADNFDFLQGTLREALFSIMGSLDMGLSHHEKIWDFWTVGPWGPRPGCETGNIRLSGLNSKNPQWFNPSVDDFNRITGMVMISPPAYARKLPLQKFLTYSAQKRYGNVFGTSRIRSLYDWWYLKGIAKAALAVISGKYGKNTPIIYYPTTFGTAEKTAALNAAVALATSAAVAMPEGTKLEWAKLEFSTVQGLLGVIDKADQQMTKILLGQVSSSGTSSQQTSADAGGGNKAGGSAPGGAQEKTLGLYLEYIGDDVAANPMAELIKEIVDYNYAGVIKYPTFQFKPLSEADRSGTVSLFLQACAAKVGGTPDGPPGPDGEPGEPGKPGVGVVNATPEDEEYIREVLGFPSLSKKTTLRPNRYKTTAKPRVVTPHDPILPAAFPIGIYRGATPAGPGLPANYAEIRRHVEFGGPGSGNFGHGGRPGQKGGSAPSDLGQKFFSSFLQSGGKGASINYVGKAPKDGYMVSAHKDREEVVDADLKDRAALVRQFKEYQNRNKDLVNEPGHYLGAWSNEGKLYLDIPVNMKDKDEAIKAGRKIGEKAIYDVKNGDSINL